jgi:putative DNA methylase
MPYPKRLIEVDLPIKRISEHARREKSIRHGHISTLHIWWARRPLAACRAVLCASLWPDPADELCPKEFVEFAQQEMIKWSDNDHLHLLSKESVEHFIKVNHDNKLVKNKAFLRQLLLDFIADYSNWDNSIKSEFLITSKAITHAAHIGMGGQPGTNPLVVDPFAGGGSIPLEALRIGADVFASDLNPLPVLLNKFICQYIPKYSDVLVSQIKILSKEISKRTKKELSNFYLESEYSKAPIAYLWARTVLCEGPNCGIRIPLLRSLHLSKKKNREYAIQLIVKNKSSIIFEIIKKSKEGKWYNLSSGKEHFNPTFAGTSKRSATICPCCGYTTAAENVRQQVKLQNGGANTSVLFACVESDNDGVSFRLPNALDIRGLENAQKNILAIMQGENSSTIPMEELPYLRSIFNVQLIGIDKWHKLFNDRQLTALLTLSKITKQVLNENANTNSDLNIALSLCFAFAIDKCADYWSSLAVWAGDFVAHTFGRQALGIVWDYAEVNGFADGSGSYDGAVGWIVRFIERESKAMENIGISEKISAINHVLPDDSAQILFTDPPYYDAVPYADLSDFFYVWLKRNIGSLFPNLFEDELSPKKEEIVQLSERNPIYSYKTQGNYENLMCKAMSESRRYLHPQGIGIVVFAHKTTSGWESQLKAMLDAGWIFTGSWPIDTERPGRLRANNSAALASSIHLVCRPRENEDGLLVQNQIGDWRDVQEELPKRIHEWMPRLADEGVVGADAIFACIGPALEVFSRFTKVVQAGSEREISLREYLEKVWAAVSQEAINMVFTGGDAQGLEEDARLTAMWLWTLTAGASETGNGIDEIDEDEEESADNSKVSGYTLEYDTARKIAQGLGANLDELKTLVEVKGDKARLMPVIERSNKLFGAAGIIQQPTRKKKREVQLALSFENAVQEDEIKYQMPELKVEVTGKTVLDRLHQAMLLFSAGRTEALKRFLVEDGVGKDDRFWKLAQALTALYPKDTDERRWVEAVQTYKKSLGF